MPPCVYRWCVSGHSQCSLIRHGAELQWRGGCANAELFLQGTYQKVPCRLHVTVGLWGDKYHHVLVYVGSCCSETNHMGDTYTHTHPHTHTHAHTHTLSLTLSLPPPSLSLPPCLGPLPSHLSHSPRGKPSRSNLFAQRVHLSPWRYKAE
jgi:hypothetical protein